MSNTNTLVTEIEERLTAILSNVNDDMGEAVEVGSALSVLIKMANITQEAIKTTIRDEAIRRQNGVPGTVADGKGAADQTLRDDHARGVRQRLPVQRTFPAGNWR